MATARIGSLRLVARTAELAQLEAAFDRVASGQGPHVTVLTAESGVGKTRLLVELYARLASRHRGDAYWPSRLPGNDATLSLNPEPAQFNWPEDRKRAAPFIWWGLRCTDPQRRNTAWSDGGAVNSAAIALLPHLYFLEHVRVANGVRWDLADLALDGALEAFGLFADSIPGVGLLKSLAINRIKRYKQAQELSQLDAARKDIRVAANLRASRLDEQLLEGLKTLLTPAKSAAATAQAIPVVVVVDDAHWLDPISARFLARLLQSAQQANWPLLLAFTAWPEQWEAALSKPATAEWQELYKARKAMSESGRVEPLVLAPCGGIDEIIRDVFPGLHVDQRRTIADKVGADLYRLRELLQTLAENDRRFVNRDTGKELSEAGLGWLSTLKRGRTEIVRDRFEQLPPELREFLGLWSVIGPELPVALGLDVVGSLAASGWPDIAGHSAQQLLERAMNSHFVLARSSPSVVGFADDAMADAAAERILASSEDVTRLRQQARLMVARWVNGARFETLAWSELPIFLKAAAWAIDDPPEHGVANKSLSRQIASSIVTMQHIVGVPVSQALKMRAAPESGTDALEATAFRARLPPRWQAKWLMQRASDLGFRAREDTMTFMELRDAAITNLSEAVSALLSESNWDHVEAASLSAGAAVSMAWSAISQFRGSGDWEERLSQSPPDAMPPVSQALEAAVLMLEADDPLVCTLRICLLAQLAEAQRDNADDFVLPVVDGILALAERGNLSNESARLIFSGPLATVLLAWPSYGPRRNHAGRVADAIVGAFEGKALGTLESFQLAALALCVPRAMHLGGPLAERYARIMDINLELIRRGMGAFVLNWTWTAQEAVMLESGHIREDRARLPIGETNLDRTWSSVTGTLMRLCAEEIHLRELTLIELASSCLRPLAGLLVELDEVPPSRLSTYITRASEISYSARTALLIAAARAWLHYSQSALHELGSSDPQARCKYAIQSLAATLLYSRDYQSRFGDWDRSHKVAEATGPVLGTNVPETNRLRMLMSCLVPVTRCIDWFPEADRGEVLAWSLMVLWFTAREWQNKSDELKVLLHALLEAQSSLDAPGGWRREHLEMVTSLIARHAGHASNGGPPGAA